MDIWSVTDFSVTKTKVQRKQGNTDLCPCEYFCGTEYCKRDGWVKAYLHFMLWQTLPDCSWEACAPSTAHAESQWELMLDKGALNFWCLPLLCFQFSPPLHSSWPLSFLYLPSISVCPGLLTGALSCLWSIKSHSSLASTRSWWRALILMWMAKACRVPLRYMNHTGALSWDRTPWCMVSPGRVESGDGWSRWSY